MQMNLTTDYAIRIIQYLCINGRASSQELSEKLGISRNYIRKLTTKSGLQNYVESYSGIRGGLQVKEIYDVITLKEIIEVMEGSLCINKCLEDRKYCDNCMTSNEECQIYKVYKNMQDILEHQYSKIEFKVEEVNQKEQAMENYLCK